MPETLNIPASGTTVKPVEAGEVSLQTQTQAKKPDVGGFIWGTGRRKTAVARVRIKPGQGRFTVNGREVKQYFTELRDQEDVVSPLKATKTLGSLDVFVNAQGGGFMGQAGAVKLGLARALKSYDPSLEPILRDQNMLTRDPREVERKKYGLAGARRRFQFSKR
ncbi:MAG: 30S ribosomal protein S9 [Phycisphaeraceae bacterium]|nr:30S ribosomal protein S9 [Phycisphaeraceae bacterium]